MAGRTMAAALLVWTLCFVVPSYAQSWIDVGTAELRTRGPYVNSVNIQVKPVPGRPLVRLTLRSPYQTPSKAAMVLSREEFQRLSNTCREYASVIPDYDSTLEREIAAKQGLTLKVRCASDHEGTATAVGFWKRDRIVIEVPTSFGSDNGILDILRKTEGLLAQVD